MNDLAGIGDAGIGLLLGTGGLGTGLIANGGGAVGGIAQGGGAVGHVAICGGGTGNYLLSGGSISPSGWLTERATGSFVTDTLPWLLPTLPTII